MSEKTIEENILKKANEKRLLGSVAIEGGNFTTAFFRQVLIFLLPNQFQFDWLNCIIIIVVVALAYSVTAWVIIM